MMFLCLNQNSMQAPHDQNFVRAKFGVLNTDGITLVTIKINESNKGMKVNTTDTISFTMTPLDVRDENYYKCALWTGSNGLTYPWVVNANGEVLVAN